MSTQISPEVGNSFGQFYQGKNLNYYGLLTNKYVYLGLFVVFFDQHMGVQSFSEFQ